MSFALFIVLNGLVLIRPEDFLPEISGAHLYQFVMIFCLLATGRKLVAQLDLNALARRPVTVCVLGVLVATGLSLAVHRQFGMAAEFVGDFGKVIVYYLLLCAVIDRPSRFRAFLGWQVGFVLILASIAVLAYQGFLHIEAMEAVTDVGVIDPATGMEVTVARMCSAGIFNDPNDLCLILTFGSLCALYRASTASNWFMSMIWALPITLFVYALILTYSRGGLLGLLAASGALVCCRYGWKRALPLFLVCAPAAVLAIGGRQSNIDVGGGTGHGRVMLWAEGLQEMFHNPFSIVFGIGAEQYVEAVGQVAHNSFVHAYVELGLLGGTLFLGAFASAISLLVRMRKTFLPSLPRELKVAWPFVVAMVVGYACGIFTLSRNYIVPTYLCLGLATSYLTMAMPNPPMSACVTRNWLMRLAVTGLVGIVFLKFFTQFAGGLGV
jgi:hypothetical protein